MNQLQQSDNQAGSVASPKPASSARMKQDAAANARPRVLLVGENDEIRRLLVNNFALIENSNPTVVHASDWTAAVEKIKTRPVDVVFGLPDHPPCDSVTGCLQTVTIILVQDPLASPHPTLEKVRHGLRKIDIDAVNPVSLDAIIRSSRYTKQVEQSLQSTISALQTTNAVERDFLAEMSEELKAPLDAMLKYSQALHLDPTPKHPTPKHPTPEGDHDRYQAALSSIRQAGTTLLQTVNNLLNSLPPQAFNAAIEKQPANLSQLLANSLGEVECFRVTSNQSILTEFCGSDMELVCYPDLLQQAVTNVLLNAIQYSPDQSEITLRFHRTENGIEIAVRDHGIGMCAQTIAGALEKFSHAETSPDINRKGSGMGLAIAKKILAAHAGGLEIRSEPNHGTVVRMRLPMATGAAGQTRAAWR